MTCRLITFALLVGTSVQLIGCDAHEPSEHPTPQPSPATAPVHVLSDAQSAKLAALRHLTEDQPLGADRDVYAAYLIKDTAAGDAELLAAALREALGGRGPQVVAAGGAETYLRKGRSMDRATGKAVKVFQARVIEPSRSGSDGAMTEPAIQVRAWWRSGRLAGRAYRYQLRKAGSKWEVARRSEELP
jgi:hypothetical protein